MVCQKKPLQKSCKLEFTQTGNFVLTDETNIELWAINHTSKVSHAAMLNTGNFVIVSSDNMAKYTWQSFDNPTDTILPSQILPLGTNLISHRMETDYSDGRFMLSVQTDGNVVLYSIPLPVTDIQVYGSLQQRDNYDPYWNTYTDNANSIELVFDILGNLYVALKNGTTNVTTGSASTKDFYQRVTLDPDGVLRHYHYPRNDTSVESGYWSLADHVPPNICHDLHSAMGTGACGFNVICTMINQRPTCSCPQWYSFLDASRKYLGCKPDFAPQSCDVNRSAMIAGYEIQQLEETNWPLSEYDQLKNVNEATCRDECLNDCFCVAAVYSKNGICWKKMFPLRNGVSEPGIDRKALLKISRTNKSNVTDVNPSSCSTETLTEKKGGVPIVARSLLLGSSAIVNVILFICIVLLFFYVKKKRKKLPGSQLSLLEQNLRPFTFKELEEATEGFKETIGKGSFGTVYKGVLSKNTKLQVAVKRLDKLELDQEAEKEFTNEVRTIGQTHHRNLVRLLGFCNEGPQRLLVYEFMSKGSLTSLLFGSLRPTWNQRAQIAYAIARGLLYLHDDCNIQIIHCDVKPQNVLLDDCLVPKISDFGLAKLLKAEQTRTTTGIRGTRGYVAPEWFKSMPITAKVDVYSFGVMLLEIICCRKNVELDYGEEAKAILTDWAYDCFRQGRLDVLVGHSEDVIIDMSRLEKFVLVALWCIQEDPSLRPSMKKVVQMLEGGLEVRTPPDPSCASSTN